MNDFLLNLSENEAPQIKYFPSISTLFAQHEKEEWMLSGWGRARLRAVAFPRPLNQPEVS